jgi:hypothetical protein
VACLAYRLQPQQSQVLRDQQQRQQPAQRQHQVQHRQLLALSH